MTWLALVALIAAISGCVVYTVPELRRRAEDRAERIRNCTHDWSHGEIPALGQFPALPFRTCRRCGKQEHLQHCPICGKLVKRQPRG